MNTPSGGAIWKLAPNASTPIGQIVRVSPPKIKGAREPGLVSVGSRYSRTIPSQASGDRRQTSARVSVFDGRATTVLLPPRLRSRASQRGGDAMKL